MIRRTSRNAAASLAAITLLASLGAGEALAQAASDQDKKFLKELDQDSNFEIKTAQLAVQKSQSQDVKQYATMLIRDHTQLKQQTRAAVTAAHETPVSAGSMSIADTASYAKLKLLQGDSFDQSYIKGLVSGNEEIVKDEKAEAAESAIPGVKKLAAHGAALDTKHAEKAKQLAQAHGVQA